MSAIVHIDGQKFELWDACTKMVRWIVRLRAEIESKPVMVLTLRRGQDKIAADLSDSKGVDKGDRTIAEIGGG